jgi:hypothetical protein
VFPVGKIRIHGNESRDRVLARYLNGIDEDFAIMTNVEISPKSTQQLIVTLLRETLVNQIGRQLDLIQLNIL